MLSSSGDDFTISHDPDLLSDDILPALRGYLYVHLPSVLLVGRGDLDIPAPVSQSVDFGFPLLDNLAKLANANTGFLKVLVGYDCSSSYGGDEAEGHGTCGSVKVATFLHVEYSFGCAR